MRKPPPDVRLLVLARLPMTSKPRSNSYVLSVRMTPDEHAALKVAAGSLTVSAYARCKLLGDSVVAKSRMSRSPKIDQAFAAKLLATLGRSELADSLSTLAKATHSGALPVTDETNAALMLACNEIADMKSELMGTLGIKED